MMTIRNFLLLILLASLWGPSFLFIKLAVAEIPPLTMAAMRVGLASVLLYSILRMQRGKLPAAGRFWKHFAVVGFFGNALPFTLFNWGELHIDSALASILNGTTPLFTIVLAHAFIAGDRLTPSKIIGAVVGFSGLLLLVMPSLIRGVQASTLGLLAVTIAACCYAIAIVYTQLNLRGLPPLVAPTAQLGMAALYLIPLSLFIEQPFMLSMPSREALGSLLALSFFGTAVAFVVYYRLIERANASFVSMVTYLVPVFGVFLGVVVLNERLGWHAYAGCVLILTGVMISNGVFKTLWPAVNRIAERCLARIGLTEENQPLD